MTKKLTYKPLPKFETKDDVLQALNNHNTSELALLPLGVGEYFPDWKFAQLALKTKKLVRMRALV